MRQADCGKNPCIAPVPVSKIVILVGTLMAGIRRKVAREVAEGHVAQIHRAHCLECSRRGLGLTEVGIGVRVVVAPGLDVQRVESTGSQAVLRMEVMSARDRRLRTEDAGTGLARCHVRG
jgi:hypothetical protein